MKQKVTTSWDDGHVLDLKLADLLCKYDLAGTFYVSPEDHEIATGYRLSKEQVRELSGSFEIGAHTMTHPKLSTIDAETAHDEMLQSKEVLEDWTGKPITSFCYPSGDYTAIHKQLAEEAGFKLARTVRRFETSVGNDPFELPTTVHAYRHWSDASPILREAGPFRFVSQYLNWDRLAISLFERAMKNGGVFHLWGHSWEIEKNGDWDRLERVFKHISRRQDVGYVTNAQLYG